jgi:hypothetical protein
MKSFLAARVNSVKQLQIDLKFNGLPLFDDKQPLYITGRSYHQPMKMWPQARALVLVRLLKGPGVSISRMTKVFQGGSKSFNIFRPLSLLGLSLALDGCDICFL